jgi:hypothetical protein
VPVVAETADVVPPVEVHTGAVIADVAADSDAWEVVVGGSWLNKVGVIVFVIGLALLVGYSMTHVGPAGRIAIGFVVSAAMLATGVVLERRAEYRNYAYGLIAGGWAGIYFTAYAMRAVDAARVLDSDVAALALLLAVAAGMVWHSLRYRSEVVTALAYVAAYAALALTPLNGFSLGASVPIAVSVLVVAQRFRWPRVQILGIVATYGLYILRGQMFGLGALDLTTFTPYAALATYWVAFEAADLAALRRPAGGTAPPPLFLLNAAGLVGAALLQLPNDSPLPLTAFLLFAGAAYLASAAVRAAVLGRVPAGDDALVAGAQGSHQGATALAAGLIAWAIQLRFDGTRETIAFALEAELLFLSGMMLYDWLIRGIGSAVAIAATLHAIQMLTGPITGTLEWTWAAQQNVIAAAAIAAVWYANREALRARSIRPLRHEWIFTPAATYLVILVARAELRDAYPAVAVLAFACVLLEAGLRRAREYRYQAYVAGAGAAAWLLAWFIERILYGTPPAAPDAWTMLGPAIALAYFAAWRLVPTRHFVSDDRRERVTAAAVAEAFGAAFLVVLEWVVVDPAYIGIAWTATAAVLGVAGLWGRVGGLRWQAYPIAALALVRVMRPILDPAAATRLELAAALLTIALLYAGSLAVRRALAHTAKAVADVEDALRMALSIVASASLLAGIFIEARPSLITVTWALQGAALLATGFPARERLMRLSGLAVLAACVLRLFVFDLPRLEALTRIISFIALGLLLLVVSWIYTRYRDRVQKYL